MDHVDEQLTLFSHDRKYHPSIRAAVLLAKKTLNRYYGLTESSEVYHIVMGMLFILIISDLASSITVLHPHHKLTYFKNAGWELEWINTAETLVCEEFECSYSSIQHFEALKPAAIQSLEHSKVCC